MRVRERTGNTRRTVFLCALTIVGSRASKGTSYVRPGGTINSSQGCTVRVRVVTKSRLGPVYAYIIPLKVGNVRRGGAVVESFGTSNALRVSKTLTMFIGPICTGKPRLGTHARNLNFC